MTNLNKNLKSRLISVLTLVALFTALNASGALAGFWRTLDNMTSNGINNPENFEYGYGYGDNGFWYGYGYGYGYGDFGYGYSSSSSGGGTGTDTGVETNDKSIFEWITYETTADGKVIITKADGTKVTFADINSTFAKEYIVKLAGANIINGYEDGTFKPERDASRAEYLKIVLRGMGIDYSDADTSKLTFADVDANSWIAKVVVKATELNMIDSANKNFRPNDSITRAESMKMLLNAAWIELVDTETSDFSDVNGWSAKYVQTAKNLGIVNGQEVNWKLVFRPNDSITRAEVAKIVVNTIEQN